jgi:Flp pilus assembly protein TadB
MDDGDVRSFRSNRPKWLDALLFGVPFGIAMGFTAKADGASWLGAGFMATSGMPFGFFMAWWASGWPREADQPESDLTTDDLQLARRTALRGPVPADPKIQAAAIRIATHHLAQAMAHRKFMILVGGVMLIATVGAASTGSLWAVLFAFSAGTTFYHHGYRPRQLKRRTEVLRAADASVGRPAIGPPRVEE